MDADHPFGLGKRGDPFRITLAADESPDLDRLRRELIEETGQNPEVRTDKVVEAKIRISTGFYDSEEVRLRILESMLGELGIGGGRRAGGGSELVCKA